MSVRFWVIGGLMGLAPWVCAQPTPIIRVPVQLVSVPALVFSRDSRVITNLQLSNFRVFDNGHARSIRMEEVSGRVSVAVVIQVNRDVRKYVPFIAKVGSALDALLAGESGEAAVIAYSDEVSVIKPFGAGDIASACQTLSVKGRSARMIDAGVLAVQMLRERPAAENRVLLFIGQPMDKGSEATLRSLRQYVEKENVSVFALSLPLLGKAFVSDTFSLQGVSRDERGGFRAGADATKLVEVLNHKAETAAGTDPWTALTAATGGTQLHFRTQRQLEDGIGAVGFQARSVYLLSFYAGSDDPGYHSVKVQVDVPGVKVYARPGYWLDTN